MLILILEKRKEAERLARVDDVAAPHANTVFGLIDTAVKTDHLTRTVASEGDESGVCRIKAGKASKRKRQMFVEKEMSRARGLELEDPVRGQAAARGESVFAVELEHGELRLRACCENAEASVPDLDGIERQCVKPGLDLLKSHFAEVLLGAVGKLIILKPQGAGKVGAQVQAEWGNGTFVNAGELRKTGTDPAFGKRVLEEGRRVNVGKTSVKRQGGRKRKASCAPFFAITKGEAEAIGVAVQKPDEAVSEKNPCVKTSHGVRPR